MLSDQSKAAFSKRINRTTVRPLSSRATGEYLCASTNQISSETSGSMIIDQDCVTGPACWRGVCMGVELQSASAQLIVCGARTQEPRNVTRQLMCIN